MVRFLLTTMLVGWMGVNHQCTIYKKRQLRRINKLFAPHSTLKLFQNNKAQLLTAPELKMPDRMSVGD
jgi:hypothetical protein